MKLCNDCQKPTNRAPQAKKCKDCRRLAGIRRATKWNKSHRDICLQSVRRWEKKHPEIIAWRRRRNKNYIRQARPLWVDKDLLNGIYLKCPPGYEVDHIIPLRGESVYGLHVPWNLQYLTPTENKRKSNKV